MTTVASDASSRIARSIPIAAVGRKYWRIDRPAVTLSAIVAPATMSPVSTSALSRCQSPGRKRHSQPSRTPTMQETQDRPADEARDVGALLPGQAEGVDLLDVLDGQSLAAPDQGLVLEDLDHAPG